MRRNIAVVTVLALTVTFCTAALAQIPSFIRGGSSATSSADLMESFIVSNNHNLEAQLHFATAFDLKDQIELLKAELISISSGQVDENVQTKRTLLTDQAQEQIAERAAAQPELSAEGRESYQKGLVSYFMAIATAREVVAAAGNVETPSLRNPMAAAKAAKSSAYVLRESPSYLKKLQSGAVMLLTYAKNNNIEVPENATSLLP